VSTSALNTALRYKPLERYNVENNKTVEKHADNIYKFTINNKLTIHYKYNKLISDRILTAFSGRVWVIGVW